MHRRSVEAWLAAYGDAWERKDAAAFAALFTTDAHYHWTPFDAPKVGTEAIANAFGAAVARQDRIRFGARLLSLQNGTALAHWECSFDRVGADHRVRLDGVFAMEFEADGRCRVFREWWHSDEPPG